ncbi:MAG: TonB-dependent receptor domain-containing protein [Rhodospirillaceae bacterium]
MTNTHIAATARRQLLTNSASIIALLVAMPLAAHAADAPAQTAAAVQTADVPAVEEVVITGSRIVRNGYEAPTPVSVLGVEELAAQAPQNIADAVNQMPVFAGSTTPHSANSSTGNGTVGTNSLNLRGLGANRTLVLLDGKRVAPSSQNGSSTGGSVDVNIVPNGLLSRVDVVTGGASAAYGSDALAGVVNFVLDHNFVGVKGSVQGGVTTYGDDRNFAVSLTGGTVFAGGRGHFLVSGDLSYSEGVRGNPRPWAAIGQQVITNPLYTATNGQPQFLSVPHVGLAVAPPGGLITGGPLKGIAFGPGGTPYPFQYGPNGFVGTEMQGGAWQYSRTDLTSDLDAKLERQSVFTRASYDITDNITVYGELQYFHSYNYSHNAYGYQLGTNVIKADNPFIPASIAAQMTALKLTSFTFGTNNTDLPIASPSNDRYFRRHVLGFNGKLDALGTDWTWDAYYEKSTSQITLRVLGNLISANYQNAIDAVTAPNGSIVCRSTLTNPTNGCVPLNVFGVGVASQAAANYATGDGYGNTHLRQDVVAASAHGEPFSSWAGPVSVAFGAEYRYESLSAISSTLDQNSQFFSGNYKASLGHYNVSEGFVEAVVPVAKETAWAKSLDVDLAARFTSYSTSGYVTTWKFGANYAPIDDVRFRVTKSRDIRAPNLGDLYLGGRSNTNFLTDPFTGQAPAVLGVTRGNPALVPEEADTTGAGIVLSPSFFPGFQASFDYYNIAIDGAIASLGAQQIINQCFAGVQNLCPLIIRNGAGVITQVNISPANVLSQSTKGYDIEASYKLPLTNVSSSWDGDLTLRALGTRVISIKTVNNASTPPLLEGAGVLADGGGDGTIPLQAPKFRYTVTASYNLDPVGVTLTAHGISSGKYNTNWIACASGCPTSTQAHPTANINNIDGVTWFDLALNYKILQDTAPSELFFVVSDLTNTSPPVIGGATGSGIFQAQANGNFYPDLRIGRTFRAGVRFKL